MIERNPAEILRALAGAQRIAIIGSPGAGKSTLARDLAARTGLPLVHLDQLHWRPGWVAAAPDEWQVRAAAAAAAERWIIDGNYSVTLGARLARADLMLWLDLPTMICLWRVAKRVMGGLGRVRADMAPGCPERIDAEFLLYVARFRADIRPRLVAALADPSAQVIAIKNAATLNALYKVPGTKRFTRAA